MATLKQDIDKIVAEFTHELLSRIQLASTQEQATVFDVSHGGSDNRGKWWGNLTAKERSEVGQKAAATRRRNSKTSRRAV